MTSTKSVRPSPCSNAKNRTPPRFLRFPTVGKRQIKKCEYIRDRHDEKKRPPAALSPRPRDFYCPQNEGHNIEHRHKKREKPQGGHPRGPQQHELLHYRHPGQHPRVLAGLLANQHAAIRVEEVKRE